LIYMNSPLHHVVSSDKNVRPGVLDMNSNCSCFAHSVDACQSKTEVVTPYWASNSAGKIRAIVNTQHFEQAIYQEICQYVTHCWSIITIPFFVEYVTDFSNLIFNVYVLYFDQYWKTDVEVPRRMQLRAKIQVASPARLRPGQWLRGNLHGLVPVPVVLRVQMRRGVKTKRHFSYLLDSFVGTCCIHNRVHQEKDVGSQPAASQPRKLIWKETIFFCFQPSISLCTVICCEWRESLMDVLNVSPSFEDVVSCHLQNTHSPIGYNPSHDSIWIQKKPRKIHQQGIQQTFKQEATVLRESQVALSRISVLYGRTQVICMLFPLTTFREDILRKSWVLTWFFFLKIWKQCVCWIVILSI
jgi:hypothetical protein